MAQDSFGRRLRTERERRTITLEAIAANTKIGIGLLRSLERDDFSRWPSGVFRRSFMRSYAEAIGLDGDEIVREFLERFPDPLEEVDAVRAAATRERPGRTSRSRIVQRALAKHAQAQIGAKAAPNKTAQPSLRLTLAEPLPRFWGGCLLARLRARVCAAALDAGVMAALALVMFLVLDDFWPPLAVAMLSYYVGAILVLGNTPGVSLFAPRLASDEPVATEAADDAMTDWEPTAIGQTSFR